MILDHSTQYMQYCKVKTFLTSNLIFFNPHLVLFQSLCFSLVPSFLLMSRLTVHRLGSRTLIRSLEVEERGGEREKATELKDRVVNLSVQSGVSSVFTAFIAVHKGSGEAVKGPMIRRNVPTPSKFLTFYNSVKIS